MFRIALIIAFSAGLAPEAGQVYKWVDEDGNVHYSDQAPPEGHEAEELIFDSTPSADDVRDAQERTARLKTKHQTSQDQRSEVREQKRMQRCIFARQSLDALESKLIPISTKGDTETYLVAAEMMTEILRLQAEIDTFCD